LLLPGPRRRGADLHADHGLRIADLAATGDRTVYLPLTA
jgi:hypothetical protein